MDSDNQDWMDEVARGRWSPEEILARRRALARRPREAARLEEELALNRALDALPRPELPPRFTQGVLDAIDASREPAPSGRLAGLLSALQGFLGGLLAPARLALLATACVAVVLGWGRVADRRSAALVRQAAELTVAAGTPGVAVFADFEAVRLLNTPVAADDHDLMEALRDDAR